MGVSWTATMDQKLLLIILSIVKLDAGAIAAKWLEEHGAGGGEQPTKRAITEHIVKLKKSLGMSPSKSLAPSVKRPSQNKAAKGPAKKKNKLLPSQVEERDDSEMPLFTVKEEVDQPDPHTPPPSGGSRSPTSGRTMFDSSPGKRKRGGLSDEDEESDDEGSVKTEASSEYRGHSIVASESPVRVMQPRRAKTERPTIVLSDTSDEVEDEEELQVDEVEVDEILRVPSPPAFGDCVIAEPEVVSIDA